MVTEAMKLKDTPWKKSFDQTRQHSKKQRHYFANKVPSSPNYGFSSCLVWKWELDYKESWALKNWLCFGVVVLEKIIESPIDFRRSNQSIQKEISPEYSLKRLMLKLKLQDFVHFMWRTDSFEKTLMLGKIEGRRRRGQQMIWWLDAITDSKDMSLSNSGSWWTGRPGMLQSMGLQIVRHDWVTELNWTSFSGASKVAVQEMWVRCLCWEGGKGSPLQYYCLGNGQRSLVG